MNSSIDDICLSGDLILEVGLAEQKCTLRVSSHALCLASPVFKAMLNSKFLEGTSKFASGERRVGLPDDDIDTVKAFCNIIHFRGTAMATPSLELFEDMSLFCDKYDATEAMMMWSTLHFAHFSSGPIWLLNQSLFHRLDGEHKQEKYVQLLYIAYAFKSHIGFAHASKDMVFTWNSTTQEVAERYEQDYVPLPTGLIGTQFPFEFDAIRATALYLIYAADYLHQYQKLIVIKCENMIISTVKPFATQPQRSVFEPWPAAPNRLCRAGEIIWTCHREMTKLSLWPPHFSQMSFARIINNLLSLKKLLEKFVPRQLCCDVCSLNLGSLLLQLTFDMQALVKPLCLKCAMANMHCASIGKNCGASTAEECRLGYGCHEELGLAEHMDAETRLQNLRDCFR